MSDLRLVDASITRLQTALFCSKPVGKDQEVSDDVGIDVRNSLCCSPDDSEYRRQGCPLILNLCYGLSVTSIQWGVCSVEKEACRRP